MKNSLVGGTGAAVIAVMFVMVWLAIPKSTFGVANHPREIVLEARGVAFRIDGELANPTLRVEPGERLKIVVKNTDPGVLHSISIPGVKDEVVHVKYGEKISFEVTVPESGRFEYICPQHAPMMKGTLVVGS